MPQFEFYIDDNEREEVINFILSKKTEIIIDKLYLSKKYETLKSANDLIENLKKEHVRYFLVDSSFRIEDLKFLDIDFDEGTKYKISQRVGGPYIDLVFYLGYHDDATIPYKSSILDHYSKFIHCNSHEEFYATSETKLYYKELVKFIKSKCIAIKKNNKTYWVSKKILEELEI